MWIFDQGDGTARLLRSRVGHSITPSKIRLEFDYLIFFSLLYSFPNRFYESNVSVYDILSCSPDRSFRRFNITVDQQAMEFSQGPGLAKKAKKYNIAQEELKLFPIVDFCACNCIFFFFAFFVFLTSRNTLANAKEREWDNIVTCHENDDTAYSWNYERKAIGSHHFKCSSIIKV